MDTASILLTDEGSSGQLKERPARLFNPKEKITSTQEDFASPFSFPISNGRILENLEQSVIRPDGGPSEIQSQTLFRFPQLRHQPAQHSFHPNGCGVDSIVDVVGNLPVQDYTNFIAPQSLRDWGNELSIAVNPVDPCQIVVSSFAYGSFIQTGQGASKASLWYSSDGGASWGIRFPINQFPVPGARVPDDQTYSYDSNGVLHGALMTIEAQGPNVYHGTTADPNSDGVKGRPPSVWQWNPDHVNLSPATNHATDQPWIALNQGQVFVGYDSFRGSGVEMRVTASADNGATFTSDNPINRGGLLGYFGANNPGLRLGVDQIGNVYSIFGLADSNGPNGTVHISYRLNMSSDGGQTWLFTNSTLDPGGLAVDDGLSLQRGLSFGGVNALRGNITSIAASPTGDHVYAVYGKRDDDQVDRIWLAEFHPDDQGGLIERDNPIPLSVPTERAALPSIAVTDSGSVYVLYDTFTGPQVTGQFHVHLAVSSDMGQSFMDQVLYDFTPSGIPIFNGDRLLGDYQQLTALGNTVYGAFSGRGNVQDLSTGIDTTNKDVPFFFSVTDPGG